MEPFAHNKQKKIDKRKQRKIKNMYKKLSIQPVFKNDILPLILNINIYSDDDLNNMQLVSTYWCTMLNTYYDKIKHVKITIKSYTEKYEYTCYASCTNDIKELYSSYSRSSCWSYKMLTTKKIDSTNTLYVICDKCQMHDSIYTLGRTCMYCHERKYKTANVKYNSYGVPLI